MRPGNRAISFDIGAHIDFGHVGLISSWFSARPLLGYLPSSYSRKTNVPIALECPCGKAFRVKEEYAGKKVRCSACKQVIVVPPSEPEPSSDEDASNFLLEEGP